MDLNGDGHHDWKDDALLGFLVSESEKKTPAPQKTPQGVGCGTVLVVFLGFCCLVSALSALLR